MLLCLDVQYAPNAAVTACIGFHEWTDATSAIEFVSRSEAPPAPYEPGAFYRRELPHLIAAVTRVRERHVVRVVVVDGHVWLDAGKRGLGAHLYEALGGEVAVVGVAKQAFRDGDAIAITRGESARPLYITAVGIDVERAEAFVRAMHGAHRIPTLLARADRLARGLESPDPGKYIE